MNVNISERQNQYILLHGAGVRVKCRVRILSFLEAYESKLELSFRDFHIFHAIRVFLSVLVNEIKRHNKTYRRYTSIPFPDIIYHKKLCHIYLVSESLPPPSSSSFLRRSTAAISLKFTTAKSSSLLIIFFNS